MAAEVQQQNNSGGTAAPALQSLARVAATVLVCLCGSSIHQRGDACDYYHISTYIFHIKYTQSSLILPQSSIQHDYPEYYPSFSDDDDARPFQLVTPPECTLTTPLKGTLV